MRASVFHVLAFASAALAQTFGFDVLISPPDQATYKVGDTLPIAWTPSAPAGKVTLTLIGGPSKNDLNPISTIASSLDSTLGTFSWPIPSAVGSFASYGVNLTIDTSTDFQYSNQFYISGGSSPSSSPLTSTATTTLVSTTQSTLTVTVPSSNSTSATPTPSGNVSNSTSLSTSASPSKTSGTASVTGSGSSSASKTSSSATPTQTKSAAVAVRIGSAGLIGLVGALMAALL